MGEILGGHWGGQDARNDAVGGEATREDTGEGEEVERERERKGHL